MRSAAIPYNARNFPSKGAWRDDANRLWVLDQHRGRRGFTFYYKCLHRAQDPRFGERIVLKRKYASTPLEFKVRRVHVNQPCSETRRIKNGGSAVWGSTVVGACDAFMANKADSEIGYLKTLTSRYLPSREAIAEAEEEFEEETVVPPVRVRVPVPVFEEEEEEEVTRTQAPRSLVPPTLEPSKRERASQSAYSSLGKLDEEEEEE